MTVLDDWPPGFTTRFHIHRNADESFYAFNAAGTPTLGAGDVAIARGDVVFVLGGAGREMGSGVGALFQALDCDHP